jgi:hypothetical protein
MKRKDLLRTITTSLVFAGLVNSLLIHAQSQGLKLGSLHPTCQSVIAFGSSRTWGVSPAILGGLFYVFMLLLYLRNQVKLFHSVLGLFYVGSLGLLLSGYSVGLSCIYCQIHFCILSGIAFLAFFQMLPLTQDQQTDL